MFVEAIFFSFIKLFNESDSGNNTSGNIYGQVNIS